MTTFGVASQRFVPKGVQDILSDINADMLSTVDPQLDLSPDQPLGQINAVMARQLAIVWELAAAAYQAFDPDEAEGESLDALSALTGTIRLAAQNSTVTANVTLNSLSTLPVGSVANVSGQSANRWTLVGQIVNGVVVPGPIISLTGGIYSAQFQSEQPGAYVANAGTLTVITTPVSGWTAVTNPTDAIIGRDVETDTALRIRRNAELAAPGSGTTKAIRAALLNVSGVLQALVFENDTLTADGTGLPGKAIQAVIYDGPTPSASNTTVAQTLCDNKPAGIQTYGSTSVMLTDTSGTVQTVSFSRAIVIDIYMAFTVTTDSTFPTDGIAQIKAAVALKGSQVLGLGTSVVALVYKAAALTIQGVIDVPILALDTISSPTSTANITIAPTQIAVLDTSRITVNGL